MRYFHLGSICKTKIGIICINAGRRKRNDSDEDIEQVLAELALEYSGEKAVKDNKVAQEDQSESNEEKIQDDDKKKKGKKDKKKEKTEKNNVKDDTVDDNETITAESNNVDMDGEVSTVKTAAQKKKEKKEREKQKKLAQKKAVSANSRTYQQEIT